VSKKTSVRKRKTKSAELRIRQSKDVSNRYLIVIDVASIENSIQPPQNFFKKLDNNSYRLRGSSARILLSVTQISLFNYPSRAGL
jgi:hypothetical protein